MNFTVALTAVRALVAKYPARIISATAAVIVFVASKVGIVVPQESVLHALELVVPVLLSGESIHHLVSPVALLSDAEKALKAIEPAPVVVAAPPASTPVAPAPVVPAPTDKPTA